MLNFSVSFAPVWKEKQETCSVRINKKGLNACCQLQWQNNKDTIVFRLCLLLSSGETVNDRSVNIKHAKTSGWNLFQQAVISQLSLALSVKKSFGCKLCYIDALFYGGCNFCFSQVHESIFP